jgi:transcriptional regulator with XRE-family HTH domain
MYPNLKAEFARLGLTLEVIAKELDVTVGTLSLKLNGKYPITLNEAKKLKEIAKTDIPLEILFEEAS